MGKYMYGRNPILSSLNEDNVLELYLKKDFSDQRFIDLAKKNKVRKIEFVPVEKLDKLVHTSKHQGVVALIKEYSYLSLNEAINQIKSKDKSLILVLDGVEDPHNLGAIIRSADAFDVDMIIIKEHGQVDVTPIVRKVSTGAIDHVKIVRVSSITRALEKLKEIGYWVYAADGSGDVDYSKISYDNKTIVVMGSEGFGISRLVLENSDFIIKIPMFGHVNSLNVSVATGIILAMIKSKN